MRILDLDLDFFLKKKFASFGSPSGKRLSSREYKRWTIKAVKEFLEVNCGLSCGEKIDGKIFTTHDEVYFYLKKLKENMGSVSFSIDHVDAHADMGMGDSSYRYIASEILGLPLDQRVNPRLKKRDGLSEGNFLMFAIANRWIADLKYIGNLNWMDDVPPFAFKNFDRNTNQIQLKNFTLDQLVEMLNWGDFIAGAKRQVPLGLEPEVKFEALHYGDFKAAGAYDAIFLTLSPGYTPKTAGKLIPVISEYINLS